MADIEELFSRINRQAANTFQFFPNEETSTWVSNYYVEMFDNIKRTQSGKFLPLIKTPTRRRKNKPRTIRSRSLLRENETSETNNSKQKLKRTASIIAAKKIAFQSNCNLKTKLRRPDKNESVLQDISNSTIMKNKKIRKQFKTNNEKENIAPSFIKRKNTEEKNHLFTTSMTSNFNSSSIIFLEDPVSLIVLSDSESEITGEQFKTPILQKYLSEDVRLPVINRRNMKKRIESSDDENEDFKKFTNISPLKTLTPNHNNSSVSFQEEPIPFKVLFDSKTEENEERIFTEDQFIEEISEALNTCNINNTSQTNLGVTSSKEPLEANDLAANSHNSNLHYTETSTPIIKMSNSPNISGFALLQKINDILPAKYEVNDSTDNMENKYKTKKDTKKVSKEANQLVIKPHIKSKIIDKENDNQLKKYTKSQIDASKPQLLDSKLHGSKMRNTNVKLFSNTLKSSQAAAQLQLEEKQRKILEKEEQAKKKREALIQIKIENQRKKREEKQLQAQKVRDEKKKQKEERLQLIRQIKEDEQQKKKAMLIEEKKNRKDGEKRKKLKKRNIDNIPLLPTGDCYDSDDPEGKVLRECYVKPLWAEYGNVTLLKINQDYIPKKCIKTFFRMPVKKPTLRLLFENTCSSS